MWKAYCDDVLFYDDATPLKEYKLIDPTLELEENEPGTFTFTLPTENVLHELSSSGYFVTGDGSKYVFQTVKKELRYNPPAADSEDYVADPSVLAALLLDINNRLANNEITQSEAVKESNEVRAKMNKYYDTVYDELTTGDELSLDMAEVSNEMNKCTEALQKGKITSAQYLEYQENRKWGERAKAYADSSTGVKVDPVIDPSTVGKSKRHIGQSATYVSVTENTYYKFRQAGELVPFKSYIRVTRDGETWFEGVANSMTVNFNLEKEVTCDGVLSFLSRVCVPEAGTDFDAEYIYDLYALQNQYYRSEIDKVLANYKNQGIKLRDVGGIFNTHRALSRIFQIEEDAFAKSGNAAGSKYSKNFMIKMGSGIDPGNYDDIKFWKSNTNCTFEYTDALSAIQSVIGDRNVSLQIVYDEKGERRLNFITDDKRDTCQQVINFGENLLDYTESWEVENLVTAVFPLGAAVTMEVYDSDGNLMEVDDELPKTYVTLADLEKYKLNPMYDLTDSKNEPVINGRQFKLSDVLTYSNSYGLLSSEQMSLRLKELKEQVEKGEISQEEADPEIKRCEKLLGYYAAQQTGQGGAIGTSYRFLYDPLMVSKYGLRMEVVNFDNETSPVNLMWEAAQYILDNQYTDMNLEVSAFDLGYLNGNN